MHDMTPVDYFRNERTNIDRVTRSLNSATRAKRLYNSTATRDAIIEEISKQIILAAKGGAGL